MRLAAVAALLGALSVGPASAADAPSLVGTWTGEGRGMTPGGVAGGPLKFVVTEQDGNAFRGEISYDNGGTTYTEAVVGAIAADGKAFFQAGDDGIVTGSIDSPPSISTCYVEMGDDAQVNCATLTKQP